MSGSAWMARVHFRYAPDPAAVVYSEPRGYPACGGWAPPAMSPRSYAKRPAANLTSDPGLVECRACWRSGPYRQALAAAAPAPVPCRSSFCDREAARGHAGWCRPCHRRWLDHGRPAAGPPPPRRSHISGRGTAVGRIEDYAWLREELGLTRAEAAARLGVTKRTALRYDARLRDQAAASQDLALVA